jgi:hypothetical protein
MYRVPSILNPAVADTPEHLYPHASTLFIRAHRKMDATGVNSVCQLTYV